MGIPEGEEVIKFLFKEIIAEKHLSLVFDPEIVIQENQTVQTKITDRL